ncbi:alkaline phosphatase [Bacillus sp. Marseille-Q1617]|uniref:alkaline phosphatase n=1 Tax=Bacillus sp. Marseille-Q1617 TaxID=2736887 RepID=UPI00158CD7D3|nr:alkaline phosphatase [Bacillus sp. Marseille-Q1617]
MKTFKPVLIITILLSLLAFSFPSTCGFAATPPKKNVIFMIMDGTNSDIVTLSRWYKGSGLNLDKILTGGVRTYSIESAITDSAAAGTAMATGEKTRADYIGMNADGKPALTVLEAAKLSGYSTGIVSTSPVQHATPAAFTAHVLNRNEFGDIGEQQVYQNLDVILGGGSAWLKPKSKNAVKNDDGMLKTKQISREDGENLVNKLKSDALYSFTATRDGLSKSRGADKLWGAFAEEDLAYDFDRKALSPDEPSLAEMTRTAIELLSANEKGFFLMVEGSKVDWAAHKNDPVGMVSEVLSFDKAVGEALEFAKLDGNTMVVAVTDHGNSGLTLGNRDTDKTYKNQPIETFIEPLKKAQYTVKGATSRLKDDRSNLKDVLESYGLSDLNRKEYCVMKEAKDVEDLENEMVKLLAKRANVGFSTHGHTGEDVFLYGYGPDKPAGLIENTDLPRVFARYLEFSLDSFSDWYVDGKKFFKEKGYEVLIDKRNPKNPELVVKRGSEELRFPENKNFYVRNGEAVELKGVNVHSGGTFYVHWEE